MIFNVLDYETRSEVDLGECGAFEYALHPSTEILCASWKVGTRDKLTAAKTIRWEPKRGIGRADNLVNWLLQPRTINVAHNALFEQLITRFVLSRMVGIKINIPADRWICTASLARHLALKGDLDSVAKILKLPVKKNEDGKKLIRAHCIPQKATKKNGGAKWNDDPAGLEKLADYCAQDVDAEAWAFVTMPELPPRERKIWLLDQKMNAEGMFVDRPLVKTVLGMIAEEVRELNRETQELTLGVFESATQRAAVLDFVQAEGASLPNLQAKTVQDALDANLVTGDARRMLEIRQSVSKSSTAKYVQFEARTRHDSRVRDMLIYCGAHTRRFTGAGLQPHNFPRGNIANTDLLAEFLATGDRALIRLLYGDFMNASSSALRSMITASPGRDLYCADFAGIEARGLFWIAKHEEGLNAFREKRDLYKEMATEIYSKDLAEVTKPEREVGTRAVLGCGYGMGDETFAATCKTFGMEIEDEIATRAVNAYRSTHWPVKKLWGNLERAALAAVDNPGTKYTINRTKWWVEKVAGFPMLICELPSGGRLHYFNPEIRVRPTKWGEKKRTLHYWGTHPKTHQWVLLPTYGGKLVENVIQSLCRDVMCESMLRVQAAGYDVRLTVHDEVLAERAKIRGTANARLSGLTKFEELMATVPEWATGFPIAVEGWVGKRYKK